MSQEEGSGEKPEQSDKEKGGKAQAQAQEAGPTATDDVNAPYSLTEAERNWVILQPFLERKGYSLRKRYRPGWTGSWVGTDKDPTTCEDSIALPESHPDIMDAVRISDDTQVMLKLFSASEMHSSELVILEMFAKEPLTSDPRNHCIGLLDVFPLDPIPGRAVEDFRVMVEPLFRTWTNPPFQMVVEGLSFVRQLLEGLAFMHSHNVAHRDIAARNVLMDAKGLYPAGFHALYNLDPTKFEKKTLPPHSRLEVPMKYYFVDFGLSSIFPSFEERQHVTWTGGLLDKLPELKADRNAPYDPFQADVFALGQMFKDYLMNERTGFGFLQPLLAAMMKTDPAARATAPECLELFESLTRTLPRRRLLGRTGWTSGSDHRKELVAYLRQLFQAYARGLGRHF